MNNPELTEACREDILAFLKLNQRFFMFDSHIECDADSVPPLVVEYVTRANELAKEEGYSVGIGAVGAFIAFTLLDEGMN